MGSKLGPHIISWDTHTEDLLNFIEKTQPAIIKVVAPFGYDGMKIAEAKRRSPDSKWLLRLYVDNQPLDNPKQNAKDFADKVWPHLAGMNIIEDYNEIDPRDHSFDPPKPLKVDTIKRYNDFSIEFSNIVHSWGKKHVTGCWSNGQPPDGAWQYLKESLKVADYLSIHNYGWETLPDCPQFALRHRRIFDLLPVKKPMILSEVGMTNAVFGGPDLGWRSWKKPYNLFAQEGRAAAVWAWFLDRINEDPYIVGANAYTTGRLKGDNWGTHDFTPRLYKLVGDYILGHPSPDPYLPNGGNNMGVWDNVPSQIRQWKELIGKCTREYSVPIPDYNGIAVSPAKVVACIIRIESNGDPHAVGGNGNAIGLMQVWKPHYPDIDLSDPETNIKYGLMILENKLKRADLLGALYAYSGGRLWASVELYKEKYWQPFVRYYKEFWDIDLEPEPEPTPDWEAKYKNLKFKIGEKTDILSEIAEEMEAGVTRMDDVVSELDGLIK